MIKPFATAGMMLNNADTSRRFVTVRFITISVNPHKMRIPPKRRIRGDSAAVAKMSLKLKHYMKQIQKKSLPNPIEYDDLKKLRLEQAKQDALKTPSYKTVEESGTKPFKSNFEETAGYNPFDVYKSFENGDDKPFESGVAEENEEYIPFESGYEIEEEELYNPFESGIFTEEDEMYIPPGIAGDDANDKNEYNPYESTYKPPLPEEKKVLFDKTDTKSFTEEHFVQKKYKAVQVQKRKGWLTPEETVKKGKNPAYNVKNQDKDSYSLEMKTETAENLILHDGSAPVIGRSSFSALV